MPTIKKCTHCQSTNTVAEKNWILEGKIINKATGKPYKHRITLFKCMNCRKTFRTSEPED